RILAVGPSFDSRLVLRALRAGADDYVDESELETELQAAIERLQTQKTTHQEPGRIIAVLAPNGGSGSSTVAVNVATALCQEHKKSSLLMDLKLETGDLDSLLDLNPAHTLADLCQNATRMDRVMFENSLVRHKSGVQLLAPPKTLADIRFVTPEGIGQALSVARAMFPYIVIDLDHTFREESRRAFARGDVTPLVSRLDFRALRNPKRRMDHLDRLGIDRGKIKMVVNRHGQPQEVPANKVEEALGVKISHFIPDDPYY